MNATFNIKKVYNLDCIKGMKIIPSNILVFTDPSFEIDFKAYKETFNRKNLRVIKGYNEIKEKYYYQFTLTWRKELKRVLKDLCSMYGFSG